MLKKTFVGTLMLGAALLMQGSLLAHADEVCNSVQECNSLISAARARLRELRSGRGANEEAIPGNTIAAQTLSGIPFGRVTDRPLLGDAWRDRTGMIWTGVPMHGAEPQHMTQDEAVRYCRSIGASLPSEEDFIRLREYMGAAPGTYRGYRPQILPELEGVTFWVRPSASTPRHGFYGTNGGIFEIEQMHEHIVAVRCVAR